MGKSGDRGTVNEELEVMLLQIRGQGGWGLCNL